MIDAIITDVVVDRRAEAGYRRRALAALPNEHMETLYGRIKDTTAYIYAFVPFEHKAEPKSIDYEEDDLVSEEDEAKEEGYLLLGTIHSHPGLDHTMFSQCDAEWVEKAGETLFAICAIEKAKNKRRKCRITYWPGVKSLITRYTKHGGDANA